MEVTRTEALILKTLIVILLPIIIYWQDLIIVLTESINNDQITVLENTLSDLIENIGHAQPVLTSLITQRFLFKHWW